MWWLLAVAGVLFFAALYAWPSYEPKVARWVRRRRRRRRYGHEPMHGSRI